MSALATLGELAERLPFEMDDDDEREAQGALEDLSEDARIIGSQAWVDAATTPHSVKNLVLRAATRHMKNYEGYTMSRAGDETVQWTDRGESSGTATFTSDEKNALRSLSGRVSIGTAPIVAWGKGDRPIEGRVPHADGRKPVTLFASDKEPW